MTYSEILDKFKDSFPFANVENYRPVCHELFEDGKEGCTIWLDSGDMVVYYPNQERGDAVNEMMAFPDTWEEFEKLYGFNDAEEIYTNNSRLIPSFRVKQWLDHLLSVHPELSNNSPELDIKNGELISRQAAIDALDEIRHALWEIDIPSPTVPEYVEHHEQVQSVWKLLDKKQKELYVLPSVQPRKGKWIEHDDNWANVYYECSVCKEPFVLIDGTPAENLYNFCPNCGCRMEEGDSDD